MKIPEGPYCQSCSKPMHKANDFGTNKDGSKNKDYCFECYKKGKFTEPNLTMYDMIDKATVGISMTIGLPKFIAKKYAKKIIPGLKRWKNR
jgi:hypothetical protein